MKLITVSGMMFENKVKSLIRYYGKQTFSEDPNENLRIAEEQLKQSITRILGNSLLTK